ncbi:MAG: adenosine deaminase [Candidatus Acidiferrales bacterium]
MPPASVQSDPALLALPKAELHLHLEGSIEPATAVELAARHGIQITAAEVSARYAPGNFAQFIETFKWVTSFLRDPDDYALVMERLGHTLARQNVLYAEITLSVGVMLRRDQDPAANLQALRDAAAKIPALQCKWIFDCVRQWGPAAAMEVARHAAPLRSEGVIAFGMGGDELSIPAAEFRAPYDFAAAAGLHRLVHAGETGDPQSIIDAIGLLGAERIGHGIAAIRSERLMNSLAESGVPLEVCPTSNLRTGALCRQLGRPSALEADHPLPTLMRRGVRVTLGSDDPAMFETSLTAEYELAQRIGVKPGGIVRLAQSGFECAFLEPPARQALLAKFQAARKSAGLL